MNDTDINDTDDTDSDDGDLALDPVEQAAGDLCVSVARLFDFEWTDDLAGDLRHLARMVDHVAMRILENDTAVFGQIATD